MNIDMVIAILPTSCGFLLQDNSHFFPSVPAIFVLPSQDQMEMVSRRPRSGAVRSSSTAIPDSIERIRTLLPETNLLIVVSGSGAEDLYYQRITQETLKRKGWTGKVEYLQGLPAEALAARFEYLPEQSAIFMLTYLQDAYGKPLTTVHVMDVASKKSAAPIFGFYDTIMGHGIVGGKLTSTEAYGSAIAETALKLFQQEKASPLIVTVAQPRDIYDWRQLDKWRIPKNRLPAGSEIRFQQIPFWREHLTTIIVIAAVFILQTFLILTLLFNLSRRKRAESAHRSSEKKYRDIFDNAVMGIYQSTPEGKYLNVNAALAKMLDYASPEELLANIQNIQHDIYVNPGDRNRLLDMISAEGQAKGFQVQYKRKESAASWMSVNGRSIRDEKGNVLYYEGTVEDITRQKQAEQELIQYRDHLEGLVKERTEKLEQANAKLLMEIEERTKAENALAKSETLYRNLVESANSIVLQWTSEGKITFVNTFAQRFFGYTFDELIGQNMIGTIIPEVETSGRDLSRMLDDIVTNPAAYEGNVNENIKKNGERVWVAWTNKPLADEHGRVTEILSTGSDITKLVKAEQELRETMAELDRAKERAESADRLKSAFLATMSHELRTPLNSIIGFTGILIQGLVGPLTAEQAKQLNMVYNSAKHLLELINDVLDLSKIEADQLTVVSEPFDLTASIEKCLKSAHPAADKKGLDLSASITPEIGAVVSDRRRVEQILLNLISNAIKFTEHGFVRVRCEARNQHIVIAVQDSGIGIKQEDMPILFNAFRQIESGITRRYDGTGLGLSICKKLAHLLGGDIEVASEWAVGSTFTLHLPCKEA